MVVVDWAGRQIDRGDGSHHCYVGAGGIRSCGHCQWLIVDNDLSIEHAGHWIGGGLGIRGAGRDIGGGGSWCGSCWQVHIYR